MEKTFQLDQKELTALQQTDSEKTQALAIVGALSLDMETARKNLDAAQERQRGCIRQALNSRGVDRYENVRVQNGAVTATVPDEPQAIHQEASGPKVVERVNGSTAIDAKE